MNWKNRIVGQGEECPEDLVANPLNWRTHPQDQERALEGVLDEVGWVQQVVVNKRTGRLIDGHLRVEMAKAAGEEKIPVLYVDLDEAEERKILAVLDPIGAMAGEDTDELGALLETVETESDGLRNLLADLGAKPLDDDVPEEEVEQGPPEMELQPYEHYDYVLVLARNSMDWNNLCAKLGLQRVDACPLPGVKKIGLGRCIDAARLLEMIQ